MAEYERETVVEAGPPGPPREGPPPPWWRENWWWPLVALLLIVGLLIAFFVWRDRSGGDEGDRVVAPDVVGLQEGEARQRVTEAGLEPRVDRVASEDPEGEVIAQEPGAGSQLQRGQAMLLSVSAGGGDTTTVVETATVTETETQTETATATATVEQEPETVAVPDFTGLQQADAVAAAADAGFVADTYPVESAEERGTVVAQNPDPETQLPEGRHVRLNVALGGGARPQANVPDVTGLEEVEARRRVVEAGFTVRTLDRDAPRPDNVGEVILQRPEPSGRPVLAQVTLYVGR